MGIAELRWRQAEWKRFRKFSAREDIRQALVAVDEVLQIDPNSADAFAIRGTILLLQAETAASPTQAAESARSALGSFEKAFQTNKNIEHFYKSYVEKARSVLEP